MPTSRRRARCPILAIALALSVGPLTACTLDGPPAAPLASTATTAASPTAVATLPPLALATPTTPPSTVGLDPRWRLPEINTWRTYAKDIDAARTIAFADRMLASGLDIGAITIDDGWFQDDALGDWNADTAAFPQMRATVAALKSRGLLVRLWIAPINVSPAVADRFPDDWFFKLPSGERYRFPTIDAFALDPFNPDVEQWLRDTIQSLVIRYDIDGLKCDFGIAAAPDQPDIAWAALQDRWLLTVYDAFKSIRPRGSVEYYSAYPGGWVDEYLGTDFAFRPRTMDEHRVVAKEVLDRSRQRNKFGRSDMVWSTAGDANPTLSDPDWQAGYLSWLGQEISYNGKLEFSFDHTLTPIGPLVARIANRVTLERAAGREVRVLHGGRVAFAIDDWRLDDLSTGVDEAFLVFAWPDVAEVAIPVAELGGTALRVEVDGQPILPPPIVGGVATLTAVPGSLYRIRIDE